MPSALSRLQYLPCAGTVPGRVYTAPGPIVAVAYNGVFLRAGARYSQTGGIITLNFLTELGDRIYALCVA